MTRKKIGLLIGGVLVLIGGGVVLLCYLQRQEKTQEIDEKIQVLQQETHQKPKLQTLTGEEADLYQDLSDAFGGEGYEQIDGEFGFTAEGF